MTMISQKLFSELTFDEIRQIDIVFKKSYKENSPTYQEGAFLEDDVNYLGLRDQCSLNPRQQFGRVFLKKEGDEIIGFLSALDDLFYYNSPAEYLDEIKNFIIEDIDFLGSLAYLRSFAFILQLAVMPDFAHQGYGRKLLEGMIDFYRNEKGENNKSAMIIASSIHQRQFRIFDLLRRSNENYQFLDQQFSNDPTRGIRFRIALILNKKEFFHRIEKTVLHKTFDIVIPIQLSLASQDVNSLISREPYGARIIWSSFFTNNLQLQKLNNMRKSYHGYYQSLKNARDNQEYQLLVDMLTEITRYLKDKDENKRGVASLTPNMDYRGFEFFFVNESPDQFEFPSFANPIVVNMFDDQNPEQWLFREEFRKERRGLDINELEVFWDVLEGICLEYIQNSNSFDKSSKKYQEWSYWLKKLEIDTETEKTLVLSKLQRWKMRNVKAGRKLFERVSNRKVISEETVTSWKKWLNLHIEMYKADISVLPENEKDYWWCHAVVPITFTEGVSGVMFSFICPKVTTKNEKTRILNDFAVTISSALSKNMLNIIGKLQQHVISMALDRYAMAAISVRNLSHNMGSHVLSHLGQEDVLKRMLVKDSHANEKGIRDLAGLHKYLRIRMSLLADMATNDPVASVPTFLHQEIIKSFKDQKLILHYLTGQYTNAVRIVYENLLDEESPSDKDVLVQLPNGELGLSAFHMILVNILRNSVKYASKEIKNTLTITIRIEKPKKGKRGYRLTIFDETVDEVHTIAKRAQFFQRNYIEGNLVKEYELRNRGLGFAEMLVAARYLRKRPFGSSWGATERRIRFLEVLPVKSGLTNATEVAHLGFQIYLKKPRLILIIDSKNSLDIHAELLPKLSELGVKIRTETELQGGYKEVHSHAIVIDLDDFHEQFQGKLPRLYPVRWVRGVEVTKLGELRKFVQELDREGLFHWTWKEWIAHLRNKIRTSETYIQTYIHPGILKTSGKKDLLCIYDNHGDGLKYGRIKHPKEYRFYEAYGGLSPSKIPLDNWVNAEQGSLRKDRLKFELEEAAITRVVVMDERMQNICQELRVPYGVANMNYFEYLSLMNIHLPNPNDADGIDLNQPELAQQNAQELAEYLRPFVNGLAEFVVIHLGLIEQNLEEKTPEGVVRWLEELLVPGAEHAEIVMISGRGKPQELPSWVRFLPYNNIAKYILDIPAKYHLCRMLFGSRTRV